MTSRMVPLLAIATALVACGTPQTRPFASLTPAETFALTKNICDGLVPAVLRLDEAAVERITRAYGVNNRPASGPDEVDWRSVAASAGYGPDIRGQALVGHSVFRDQYRIHYRISYFKSGEMRSELVACGLSSGDGTELFVRYYFGFDRDIVRGLTPPERSTTDRREEI